MKSLDARCQCWWWTCILEWKPGWGPPRSLGSLGIKEKGVNAFQRIAPKTEVCGIKGKFIFVKLGLYELGAASFPFSVFIQKETSSPANIYK